MDNNSRSIQNKIFFNGIAAVVSLLALYILASLLPAGLYVYVSDFSGIMVIGFLALAISALWLSLYWFMDSLQKEPLPAILITFFFSACVYLAGAALCRWICPASSLDAGILESAIFDGALLVCAFFLVFVFYIVKIKAFDEIVDSFIYGACAGIGIACARCIGEFVQYESVSVLFLTIELITRISVYAALCSLLGWLLHNLLLSKKNVLALASSLGMMVLFIIEAQIERAISLGIESASIKILPVLVSLAFVVVIVAAVTLLIHSTLKKQAASNNQGFSADIAVPAWLLALLVCLVILPAFAVRYQGAKTVSFERNGWAFKLPADFVEVKESSLDDVFVETNSSLNAFYQCNKGTHDIRLYLNPLSSPLASLRTTSFFSPQNGWTITENRSSSSGNCHYEYVLEKERLTVFVDVYADQKDDAMVSRAVRILARTLKEVDYVYSDESEENGNE